MLRAAARRRLRSNRRHSSSHLISGLVGVGFELLARHLTSCCRPPQGQLTTAFALQVAVSLQANKQLVAGFQIAGCCYSRVCPWQVFWQVCSQNSLVLPQTCSQ